MLKTSGCLIAILSIFIFSTNIATWAQEDKAIESTQVATSDDSILELESPEEYKLRIQDLRWVWGEVLKVDINNKQLSISYLDYNSDTARDALFLFEEDSKFENITSLEDIKIGDSAGVDYYIDDAGSNIIKSISIEKLRSP